MIGKTSRRALLALAAAALALAGCGSDDDGDSAATGSGGGTFPATVTHKFGTTTVEREPRRIVVVGLTEQDTVLALGYKPIATTEWYGDQPNAVWPWARDELGDARPEVLSTADGFEYEKIARLRPDLIIGANAGLERADYRRLSQIAPTVAGPRGSTDYFGAWDQLTVLVATALGKREQGLELVEDIKEDYREVAEDHPQFAGKTATFSQNAFYDGRIYVYPDGLNTEFLTYLGFRINPRVTALATNPGEQAAISAERLDALEADVIVFATETPSDVRNLERVPTFRRLRAVAENRSVYTSATLSGAMYFMTPLSLPYVLEHLTPQLVDALAGEAPRRQTG